MENYDIEFLNLIDEFLKSEDYCLTKNYISHRNITTFEHQINVAYLCYKKIKSKRRKKYDLKSTIRGAMLHDFYLYDWHDSLSKHKRPHGFFHAHVAYINAKMKFPINDIEKDIIIKHMFPLTLKFPRYKESWLVVFMDKKASLLEIFGKYKKKL